VRLALSGKKVVLGVTGSIAAYKSLQIVRDLTEAGASVQGVLTRTARRFVPALTLQIFSGQPVGTHLFDAKNHVAHVTIAQDADLILVAPVTAHFIAKMVAGLADDLLGNILLSSPAPVWIAPAMDVGMWDHPAMRQNIALLRERGVFIIEPEIGALASGAEGMGRLADPSVIFQTVASALSESALLKGKRVLVTAGPTEEPIDPIRFISNRSSGKMGYALAQAARIWGGEVLLISGPSALPCPSGVKRLWVRTAEEMKAAVDHHAAETDFLLMAAAVSDYRPTQAQAMKIKKSGHPSRLTLEEVPDILQNLPAGHHRRVVVGFAAETENLIENARAKCQAKGLDLIVANDVTQEGAGFDVDTNIAHLIDRTGQITSLPKMSKTELARHILHAALARV
jgi:phosphopantothenoylcysteine decarboxylase/phosphopantothenate--cysteine ligase